MLHERTWKYLSRTLFLCSVICSIPYECDGPKKIRLLNTRLKMFIFRINCYICNGYLIFAIIRLPKSLMDDKLDFFDAFNHAMFIIFLLIISVFYLSNYLYKEQIVLFFNQLVEFDVRGQKEYNFDKTPLSIREFFVWTMLPAGLFIIPFWILLFLVQPFNYNYLFTLMPQDKLVKWSPEFWYFIMFESYFACSLLGCGVGYAAFQLSIFQSFLAWSQVACDIKQTNMEKATRRFRIWNMMINIFYNECFAYFLTPLATLCLALLGTTANFGTIHLLHQLDDPSKYANFNNTGIAWGVNVFVFLFYTNAASYDQLSRNFRRVMTQKKLNETEDDIFYRKTVKSIEPYSIRVGHFYALKSSSSTVYITGMVNYTLSLLITYPP